MDYNGTRDCCLSLFYFSLHVVVREINKINYNNSQNCSITIFNYVHNNSITSYLCCC